jgi:Phosphotransferase enzyme family
VRVWEWSHVLRLRTPHAVVYMKACATSGAAEPRLTDYLARFSPRRMPSLLAVEVERRWLLMRATEGPALMDVGDFGRWAEAATALADVQLNCMGRVSELATLGCPQRPLSWLQAEIEPLLADRAALQPKDTEALSDAEVERLGGLASALRAMCDELASYGVPMSIEHGDLWADNVIAAADGCVLIDWEDATIAHPFFSAFLLLESLRYTRALVHAPDAPERIRDAYLAPWRDHGPLRDWRPERLRRAFDLSQKLAPLHYAVQFRRFAIPTIETSWEIRAFCPLFLRALLRELLDRAQHRPPAPRPPIA